MDDRAAVRRLVDEAVAVYDERTLTGSLPPLPDTGATARSVYDAVAGLGPLQRHLDAPEVAEICVKSQLTVGSPRDRLPRAERGLH